MITLPCIPKIKDTLGYQTALLGISAGLATACLLLLNLITAPAIAMRAQEDQLAGLEQVMPAERYQNELLKTQQAISVDGHQYQLFTAQNAQGDATGYIIQTTAAGYAGDITLLIGVDDAGTILGVRVLAHSETPGLGDKIELAKNDWVLSFNGHSLSNTSEQQWAVKKDGGEFDQFSGATITPRAVVTAVHRTLISALPKAQETQS